MSGWVRAVKRAPRWLRNVGVILGMFVVWALVSNELLQRRDHPELGTAFEIIAVVWMVFIVVSTVKLVRNTKQAEKIADVRNQPRRDHAQVEQPAPLVPDPEPASPQHPVHRTQRIRLRPPNG